MTDLVGQVASLQQIVENMAKQHVIFFGPDGGEIHVAWCPLCRLERCERIGSPAAIAEWVRTEVVPMLGVTMRLPQKAIDRGEVLVACSAGDLLNAIANAEVLLGGG